MTATRSFVPGSVPRVRSFPPSSRATTAWRSFRGERRPLSSAVDKPYVDNGVSSTGPMLITASRKTQSPSSAGKNSPP
jgi:hypothetical protein